VSLFGGSTGETELGEDVENQVRKGKPSKNERQRKNKHIVVGRPRKEEGL